MKALGIIDCSFPLDVAKRSSFKPTIGRMLLGLGYKRIMGSIRGLDLIFLDLAGGPMQSFSRIVHRHYNYTISLGLSLISSVSRYQSIGTGYRDISVSNISHKNLTGSNTLLFDNLEINRQFIAEKMPKLVSLSPSLEVSSEPEYDTTIKEIPAIGTECSDISASNISHKNLICSNTVLIEKLGINKLFNSEKTLELVGLDSSLGVDSESEYEIAIKEMPASRQMGENAISISKTYWNTLVNSFFGYQSIGTGYRDVSVSNISHKNLTGSNTLLFDNLEINRQFIAEKMPKLVSLSPSLEVSSEPEYDTTIKEMPAFIGQGKNAGSISNYKAPTNNKMGLKAKKAGKMISEQIFPCLDIFTGRQISNNLIKNTIQRIDTLSSLRNEIFSRQHSAIGVRSLSYQKYNLWGTREFTGSSQLGMRDMKTAPRGTVMMPAEEYHTCTMPSLNEGHLIYPTFRKGSDGIQDINVIEKESIETKAELLPSRSQAKPTIDLNCLADQIYSRIQRLTKLERERRGM